MLIEHFEKGGSLTVLESIHCYGIYALSQRCGEINADPKRPFTIDSKIVEINGKHFSKYWKHIERELFQ
mgnify:CR=1 FL=1